MSIETVKSEYSIRKQDILFGMVAIFVLGIMIWKCPFGYGGNDEAFYLTIPHRLTKGDALLSQEWHLSQLGGFLLYPLVKIYLWMVGTTDGIILNFRYLYVLFQGMVTVVLYYHLRKYQIGGVVASLLFLIFCPYDIMAICYNTMGLASVALISVILGTMEVFRKKRIIISGMLLAVSILCNPYMLIVYGMYIIVVLGFIIVKKKHVAFSLQSFCYLTMGAGVVAVLFLTFVLSRANMGDIMKNLPLMLQDPEHKTQSFKWIIYLYVDSFRQIYKYFLLVWMILLAMICLDKGRIKRRAWYFSIMAVSVVWCILGFVPTMNASYNFIMVPIGFAGLVAFLLTNHKNSNLFIWGWILGVCYSFAMNASSNQAMYAISMAFPVVAITSVILISEFLKEYLEEYNNDRNIAKNILIGTISLLFIVQLFTQVAVKISHTFWEPSIKNLTAVMEDGPKSGLRTTPEKQKEYQQLIEDLKAYQGKSGTILFFTESTWCYLYVDMDYGTFSAWSSLTWIDEKTEDIMGRWLSYYKAHPEKIPDYIYVPRLERKMEELEQLTNHYEYTMTETAVGYHLRRQQN
ncbi:MAG TPA: hypothetical protein VJZ04_04320 [Lachnospiraceae bacterium]|nr:hypothetical protein [Lachnospiraceae bacterium]